MKRLVAIFIGILIVLSLSSVVRADVKTGEQNGRYQICYSTLARADTFLLDTQTGKVWNLVKKADETFVWQQMVKD